MYIIIIILVTTLVFSKFFLNVRYFGHDTIFHVTNITKLSETISFDNIFGSNIITYEFNKFGYGVWLFYPKLPHLTAAYLYLFLKDIYLSMKIVYFITTIMSGIFTFFLSKKIFNDKKIALLSSIIYVTVPYHICEIYIRDAFAENFMFLVLPLIFLGLYNLKEDNYIKFYICFILGYIIGINSHLGSMFFYTIFIGLFILYYRKDFFAKKRFIALLKSSLIVTGFCLPFLGPLLEHKIFGNYRVFTAVFSSLEEVKIFSLNYKDLFLQKALDDGILPYFNIITLVLFCFSLCSFIFNKDKEYRKDKKICLFFIILLINVMCSKVIWDYLPSLFISIQFPWRLLVFMSLFVSLFSPLILLNKRISVKFKNAIICILVVLISLEGVSNISYDGNYEISVIDARSSIKSMGYQREYFPVMTAEDIYIFHYDGYNYKVKDYIFRTSENVMVEIIDDKFPNMKINITNVNEESFIEFPRIFYFGYELLDNNGNSVELHANDYGMIEAIVSNDGIYTLKYVKSKIHRISEFICVLTFLTMICVLVVRFIKWKRKK